MSRKPRPLPRTSKADIERLKKTRERLVKDRKSTAVVDRLLCIAVARQIRREVKEAS
jgi:hypothetical protein